MAKMKAKMAKMRPKMAKMRPKMAKMGPANLANPCATPKHMVDKKQCVHTPGDVHHHCHDSHCLHHAPQPF